MNESTAAPPWLTWARSLQAISQIGLTFNHDVFDRERYTQIAEIAAEILAQYTNLTRDQVLQLNAQELGYATPKVDVRAALVHEGKLLLVQETLDQGRWTLPGGWADVNETPSRAAVRELYEETGYRGRAVKLIGVWDRERQGHTPALPYSIYKLCFLCELTGGAAKSSHETGASAFFAADALPPNLSISRATPAQLARCFAHAADPTLPTEFD